MPHLYGAMVTDKDGVALVRAMSPILKDVHVDPGLSSSFTSQSDQSSKLGWGPTLSIVSYYDSYTLLQINLLPLVVTLLASPDANVQQLENLRGEIAHLLEPVRTSVATTVNQQATQES